MSHITRTPPIKVKLDKTRFNILVEVLNYNELNSMNEKISSNAKMLKNKLLTYSVPREDEEKNQYVDVRLYITESAEIIMQYIEFNKDKELLVDYHSILLKVRDRKKEQKENIED